MNMILRLLFRYMYYSPLNYYIFFIIKKNKIQKFNNFVTQLDASDNFLIYKEASGDLIIQLLTDF